MDVVGGARHVRARLLVGARVGVHPALVEAAAQGCHIVRAERRHRFEHELLGSGQRELDVALDQRRVDVGVAHRRYCEHARAQLEVAVQGRQALVGLGDQRVHHCHRQPVGVERAGHGVRVVAHLGVNRVFLKLAVERDAERALEGLEGTEEGVHHALAVVGVGRCAVQGVGRAVEPHFLAAGEFEGRPRQIGVGKDLVGVATGRVHQRELRDERLACVAQRVRRGVQDLVERVPVDSQAALLRDEALHLGPAHAQDLGADEGKSLAQPRPEHLGFLRECQARRHAGVARKQLTGIHGQARKALVDVGLQVQTLLEACRARAEPALAATHCLQLRFEPGGVGLPGGHAGVEIGKVPAVGARLIGRAGSARGQRERQQDKACDTLRGPSRETLHEGRSEIPRARQGQHGERTAFHGELLRLRQADRPGAGQSSGVPRAVGVGTSRKPRCGVCAPLARRPPSTRRRHAGRADAQAKLRALRDQPLGDLGINRATFDKALGDVARLTHLDPARCG